MAALAFLVLATTGHRFANGLVFDDVHVIEEGTVIHDPSNLALIFARPTMFASDAGTGTVQSVDTYRPIPIALFIWDAAISGRQPWSYQLTNLLLHIANTWLLYLLGILLFGKRARLPSLYGAAVFAVHPWLVEAHVWINGRSDPLALLFGLLALISLLLAEWPRLSDVAPSRSRLRWTIVSGVFFFLGLLSKEVLILLGPVFVFLPVFRAGRASAPESWSLSLRRLVRRALTFGLGSIAYLIARFAVLGGMQTHGDSEQFHSALMNLPYLLVDSLGQALWPRAVCLRSLVEDYSVLTGAQRMSALVLVLLLAIILLWGWSRRPRGPLRLLPFSLVFFAAPLFPVAMITTLLWPGYGRYLYLPVAGLAIGVMALSAWVLELKRVRKSVLVVAAAIHLLSLGLGAAVFTGDFRNNETLYGAVVRLRPEVAMGPGFLGLSLAEEGEHARALPLLLRAVELAPDVHRYLAHAGYSALALGNRTLAAAIAEDGIERFRDDPHESAYHLIALNSLSRRDPELAVSHLLRCLEVYPGRPDCLTALNHLVGPADREGIHRGILERRFSERPELGQQIRSTLERQRAAP